MEEMGLCNQFRHAARSLRNTITTLLLLSPLLLFVSCEHKPLVSPCPAPQPCFCRAHTINCHHQNLTAIVNFTFHVVNQDTFLTLDFSFNNVNQIYIKAFNVLEVNTLLLNNNNVTSIHPWGFKGLERSLRRLDLSENNLKTLPEALELLVNIVVLHVHSNPIDGSIGQLESSSAIDGFTDHVMYTLGKNVTDFSFGHMTALRHWPYTLRHFQQLRTLKVRGVNMVVLHPDAFHGFDQTIRTLTIENAAMIIIPDDIEHLRLLEELHINYNRYSFGDDIFQERSFAEINSTLKTLSLSYDNLTAIPETLKYLRHLQNFSFEGNKLDLLTEHAIELLTRTNISYLSFKHCILKRIPSSINQLENLQTLDLSFNRLVTIENHDLQNVMNLEVLRLNDNPLRYMAASEMIGMYSLYYLNLTNTKLTNVPHAIRNLISLEILDIENVDIDCTCELAWLKRWIVQYDVQVIFYGQCETIDQTLHSYVHDRLPSCPDLSDQLIG